MVNDQSVTLIRIYPDENNPGHSITRISFYYSQEAIELAKNQPEVAADQVYDIEQRENAAPSLATSLEVFCGTVEFEDYAMGEM